jgi:hypothetical protein
MNIFGSFDTMAAGMGQNIHGSMSVFNATEGRFEGGAFMPPDNRRRLDEAFNDLNRGFVWTSSLIGGYREGSPELEQAWLRLQELRGEVQKVAVGLMPFG